MKVIKFLLTAVCGAVAGFMFWTPIVVGYAYYVVHYEGGFRMELMFGSWPIGPELPVLIGTALGILHGITIGICLAVFETDSTLKAIYVGVAAIATFVAGVGILNFSVGIDDPNTNVVAEILGGVLVTLFACITLAVPSAAVAAIAHRLSVIGGRFAKMS